METPVKSKYSVNIGGILIHRKWKDTKLSAEIKAKFNNVAWRDTGPYDFCLFGDRYVIYIPESDLVANINPRTLTDTNVNNLIIIAVRNTITVEQYSQLQDLSVILENKMLIPVGDAYEIPDILHQLSYLESTPKRTLGLRCSQLHLNLLLNIPGLGKLKAEKLLNTYGTIHKIASCSVRELSSTLGPSLAGEVYKYFN